MKKLLPFLVMIILCQCRGHQPAPASDSEPLTIFKDDHSISYKMSGPFALYPPCVSIVSVGDIMIGNHTIAYMERLGLQYPFAATASVIKKGDMALANLESPFTDTGTRFEKTFTFKVPPQYGVSLLEPGIDVVTLANNHILDYGIEGLNDTITLLDSIGILHCGAGNTKRDARQPAIFQVNGFRIAVLGYSMTFPEEFFATNSSGGTNYPHENNLVANIQRCDTLADFTVVTFHWGEESSNAVKSYQRRMAHRVIDLGADLVVGHHPHVLQGLEIYKNRLIAYSLGNYAFSSYSTIAREGMILKTCLSTDGLLYAKVYPMSVDNYKISFQPKIVHGAAADTILQHLRNYTRAVDADLHIDENGFISGCSGITPDSTTKMMQFIESIRSQ